MFVWGKYVRLVCFTKYVIPLNKDIIIINETNFEFVFLNHIKTLE